MEEALCPERYVYFTCDSHELGGTVYHVMGAKVKSERGDVMC